MRAMGAYSCCEHSASPGPAVHSDLAPAKCRRVWWWHFLCRIQSRQECRRPRFWLLGGLARLAQTATKGELNVCFCMLQSCSCRRGSGSGCSTLVGHAAAVACFAAMDSFDHVGELDVRIHALEAFGLCLACDRQNFQCRDLRAVHKGCTFTWNKDEAWAVWS